MKNDILAKRTFIRLPNINETMWHIYLIELNIFQDKDLFR